MSLWDYSVYSKVDEEVKKYFPYTKARENQLETISEIKHAIDLGYKYIILEAGTGTGKSAIAATLALMYDSTYILTVTKQLQEQYFNDFSDLGFKVVKGRGNFQCRKYLENGIEKSCDEGRCVIEGYHCQNSIRNKHYSDIDEDNTCYYDYQKWIGLNSSVVIANYPYLFLELNYVENFKKRQLMIFDEAHNLENTIMNQLKLEFTRNELKDDVGINLSSSVVNELETGDYKTWIKFILRVRDRYSEGLNKVKNIKNKPELKEKINYFKRRINDCDRFIKHINQDPNKWMFDYDARYKVAEFKPIKVDGYGKDTFFEYGDICLFMSATILDYKLFAEWLGINEDEVYAIRKKSPFEINRNPIVTYYDYDMKYNTLKQTAPLTINTVKEILENHKNDKGIIHTISYQCKNFLKNNLNSNRLIDHKTHNRASQLEKFKNSDKALVLISPSMSEGVDLPGNLCRFQIIYKIPFPSLADKQTKLRNSIDSKWYKYKTALALVQTVGRGMRYEKDYCTTYFMDNRLYDFISSDVSTNNFLPETFINAINVEPVEVNDEDDSFKEVSSLRDDLDDLIDDDFKMDINLDDFNWEEDELENLSYDDINLDDTNLDNNLVIDDSLEEDIEIYTTSNNDMDFYEKIDFKYELYVIGNELLKQGEYHEAIEFYNEFLHDEIFKNDYHPYIKLAKAYHGAREYENEVKIIEKFFKSGIYCTNSKIKKFKKQLKKLDELGYYNYSQIDNLESEFNKNGSKNKKLSGTPIPLAVNIKKGKKNIKHEKIDYDSKEFDNILDVDNNLTYEEKVDLKYDLYLKGNELLDKNKYKKAIIFYSKLLNHGLFMNDYHPYLKLAICYRKKHLYDKEVDIVTQFFKSGVYCNKKQCNWFKKRLKDLYKYGNYDFSQFSELKNEYDKNGALNKNLSNVPVPIAIKIKELKENQDFSETINSINSLIDNFPDINFNEVISENLDRLNKSTEGNRLSDIDTNAYYVDFKLFSDDNYMKNDEEDSFLYEFSVDELENELMNMENIYEYDENLSEKENIKRKIILKLKGNHLFYDKRYSEAIHYYNDLMDNSYFINDWYPYRQICIINQKLNQFENNIEIIKKLFLSGIYCNYYQYNWFMHKLFLALKHNNLSEKEIKEFLLYYDNNGLKNKNKLNIPVILADRFSKKDGKIYVMDEKRFNSFQLIYGLEERIRIYFEENNYSGVINVVNSYFEKYYDITPNFKDSYFKQKLNEAKSELNESDSLDYSSKNYSNNEITVASKNFSKLLNCKIEDEIIIRNHKDRIKFKIIEIYNPDNEYYNNDDFIDEPLEIKVVKRNFRIVETSDVLFIKHKSRSGQITLKRF